MKLFGSKRSETAHSGPARGETSSSEANRGARHIPSLRRPSHFVLTTLSALTLVIFLAAGATVQVLLDGVPPVEAVGALGAAVIGGAIVIAILPLWPIVLAVIVAVWAAVGPIGDGAMAPALAIVSAGLLIAPTVQIVQQWERALVFRLGRFHRTLEPGPHLLLPVLDTIVAHVDMRIRVTDFSAERSVTRDTVPVHVDALAFWMVWDAEKAILEVEKYRDAVTLSAQAALRDNIGRNDLSKLLSERERLGSEIQEILDRKTSPWGITILSIEFKEVLLPKELEDALSRKAQAERERQSRVILSSAEVEIAEKFEEAGRRYERNPTAFQLRAMNMVYDGMKQNENMMLIPSSALDSMNLGTALGAAALRRGAQPAEERPHNDSGDPAAEPEGGASGVEGEKT